MRSWISFGIIAMLLLLAPSTSAAFDQKRKGLILGFGVGPSVTSFTQDFSHDFGEATSNRETKFGVSTDFKVGWGLTEQLLVYYIAQIAWFRHDDVFLYDDPSTDFKDFYWVAQGFDPTNTASPDPEHLGEPATKSAWLTSGVGGLGVTYYLGDTSPWYVMGAFGFSAWTAPFENDDWLVPFLNSSQTWFGYGFILGGGYELFRNWSIEANAMWGNPSEKGERGGFQVNTDTMSFQILFAGLLY